MTKGRSYFKNSRVLVLHLQPCLTPTKTMRVLYNLTLQTWPWSCNPNQLDWICSWRHHVLFCFVWVFCCWWWCVCFLWKRDTEIHSFSYDTTGFCCIRTGHNFVPSKNLSCCIGQQGNLAIPSPLPGMSQGLKGSNSTQVSDSPCHQAFQQVRVPLGWIHCELLRCLVAHSVSTPAWAGALLDHSTHPCHHTGVRSDTPLIFCYFC